MESYHTLLRDVIANGSYKMTRAVDPASGQRLGAVSVFGRTWTHDMGMTTGFPLLTTKKIFWKGVVEELLWFIRGETNVKSLQEKGVHIWDAWSKPNGDVGPIYGRQWRRWENVQLVTPHAYEPPTAFPTDATVCGVGVTGNPDTSDPYYKMLQGTWIGMIHRCYDPAREREYAYYGARGVHVDPRWFVFENFQKDARNLPGWYSKVAAPDAYSLDKDRRGSNRYGPETCVWASEEEQKLNTDRAVLFEARHDTGEVYTGMNARRFAIEHELDISSVYKSLRGQRGKVKGWAFKTIDTGEDVPRIQLIDQLREVTGALLVNPDDRRIVVSAWNPADLDKMGLPPCHYAFQFTTEAEHAPGCASQPHFNYFPNEPTIRWKDAHACTCAARTQRVRGDDDFAPRRRLNCLVHMRSADIFLGVPFNIASYALLLRMMAHTTNHVAGRLMVTFGDLHLYENHFAQAEELLLRKPRPLPTVKLRTRIGSIDEFTADDIVLEDYDPYPAIKAPVGV